MDKQDQFTAAIKANESFIFKIAAVYTNTSDDKKDLVQEILFQLWKSFDSFQEKSTVATWIYRVALNVALYQMKLSKKRFTTIAIEDDLLKIQDFDNEEAEERWKIFKQQIDILNPLDKAILMLYLEEKTHEEIADIIGISKSNVGTKLQRIKEKLKSKIKNNIKWN